MRQYSNSPRHGRVNALGISVSLILTLGIALAELKGQPLGEYQVKAAFLYNFAKFIDWPAEAFRTAAEPFSICVLGADPFGHALDDVVSGQMIGARPVAIRRITDVRQIGGCHILFVSASSDKHVFSVLASVIQPGLLTIGDAGNAGAESVIILLSMENGKVRFDINAPSANARGLHISAKLLSLAQRGGK
jgi:hypothetical protein